MELCSRCNQPVVCMCVCVGAGGVGGWGGGGGGGVDKEVFKVLVMKRGSREIKGKYEI